MTLAEILQSLLFADSGARLGSGLIAGLGHIGVGEPARGDGRIHVLGVVDSVELGVEQAIALSGRVLHIAEIADDAPILMLLDCRAQRKTRRDELLGLNEYLAHLAKALMVADQVGHRTVGLLYGGASAGALIATGLAASVLAALPDATPEVMDFASMARVTKLSIDAFRQKTDSMVAFAPGLGNLVRIGGVCTVLRPEQPLASQIAAVLRCTGGSDERDRLGLQRQGRPKAASIAERVAADIVNG